MEQAVKAEAPAVENKVEGLSGAVRQEVVMEVAGTVAGTVAAKAVAAE